MCILSPDGATTQKIIERRCGETRVIVVRVETTREQSAFTFLLLAGAKSVSGVPRSNNAPRAARERSEKRRVHDPCGASCVKSYVRVSPEERELRKFLRSTPVDIVKRCLVSFERKSWEATSHYLSYRHIVNQREPWFLYVLSTEPRRVKSLIEWKFSHPLLKAAPQFSLFRPKFHSKEFREYRMRVILFVEGVKGGEREKLIYSNP